MRPILAALLLATALRAQITSRHLKVAPGADIPITIIQGRRPGPTLALVAGIHGYEYTPILALQRVRANLSPEALSGTVILVHVANLPSFLKRTIYYGPDDGKNLNRVFPGRPDGTLSERIAQVLTTEVIEKADYLIDLHCGDGNESLRPYTYWIVGGDAAVDAQSRDLALAYGLDHILVDHERPRDPAASLFTANTDFASGRTASPVPSAQVSRSWNCSGSRSADAGQRW